MLGKLLFSKEFLGVYLRCIINGRIFLIKNVVMQQQRIANLTNAQHKLVCPIRNETNVLRSNNDHSVCLCTHAVYVSCV